MLGAGLLPDIDNPDSPTESDAADSRDNDLLDDDLNDSDANTSRDTKSYACDDGAENHTNDFLNDDLDLCDTSDGKVQVDNGNVSSNLDVNIISASNGLGTLNKSIGEKRATQDDTSNKVIDGDVDQGCATDDSDLVVLGISVSDKPSLSIVGKVHSHCR